MEDIKQMQERYGSALEQLRKHQIPESYPEADRYPFLFGEKSLDEGSLFVREEIIRLCGYSFLSYNWIRPLAEWIGTRKCLEIMCGSGALSFALRTCGVNVHATDNYSWEQQDPLWFQKPWIETEKLDCIQSIEKYGKEADLLICSWPYMDDTYYRALLKMREINSDMKMIYIGEPKGMATASDDFFDTAIEVEDDSFYEAVQNYRSVFSLHDRPFLIK